MKIQTQLNRIERELDKVAQYIGGSPQSRGVDTREAFKVAQTCTQICETAAIIAGQARETLGNKGVKKRLVTKVRKALGFVYP
jgi:hypothetical protein